MKKLFFIFLISSMSCLAQEMEIEKLSNIPPILTKAIDSNNRKKLEKAIKGHHEALDIVYSDNTLLTHAASSGKVHALECLILYGCCVNKKDRVGWTPLMNAAWIGNLNAAQLLVSSGADIMAQSDSGSTASQIAKNAFHHFPIKPKYQHKKIVSFLSAPFQCEILCTQALLAINDTRRYALLNPDLAILCIDYAYGPQSRQLAYNAKPKLVIEAEKKPKEKEEKPLTKKRARSEVELLTSSSLNLKKAKSKR
jgi:hypothetical protein